MSQDLANEFADVRQASGAQMPLTAVQQSEHVAGGGEASADEVEAAYERALKRLNGSAAVTPLPSKKRDPKNGQAARGAQPAPVKPPAAKPQPNGAKEPGTRSAGTPMTPGDGLPPVRGGMRPAGQQQPMPEAGPAATVVGMTATQAQQIVGEQFSRLRDEIVSAVSGAVKQPAVSAKPAFNRKLAAAVLGGAIIATWFLRGAVDGRAAQEERMAWYAHDLPALKHTLSTPIGKRWVWMAEHNPPGSLGDVEHCSAAAGLHRVQGVCAGSGAHEGWRPAP